MDTVTKPNRTGRYKNVDQVKSGGKHYTPEILSEFVASQIIRNVPTKRTTETISVLDPGLGDGELLLSLVRSLANKGFSRIRVCGFETSEVALNVASSRLKQAFPKIDLELEKGNFLEFVLENYSNGIQGNLFTGAYDKFDLIISNPPYVRTQIMGAEQAQKLARQFSLSGRVDLYYAFLHGMAMALKPGGTVGVIISNRFMTTKSGAAVRKMILDDFDITNVWDFGDTRLFEAAVLPAVLLMKRKNGHSKFQTPCYSAIYTTNNSGETKSSKNVITALKEEGLVEIEDGRRFKVDHGKLYHGDSSEDVWRISTKKFDEWLANVEKNTWATFKDIGKIRVGVKTTADKVFIRSDWNELEEKPELLRPLVTHHVAQRYKSIKTNNPKQILYPHCIKGGKRSTVDLKKYPRALGYLEKHRSTLESRKYVIEAGRNWFEIWVPHDPNIWEKPKLIFRDISEKPTFWLDQEGAVVNGDCYWLVCRNQGQLDLLWLALAVGNATFIEEFYDRRFHNKLYAGRRRFMTQYVENFPLPDPRGKKGKDIVKLVKKIYSLVPSKQSNELENTLDKLVWEAFGLSIKKVLG